MGGGANARVDASGVVTFMWVDVNIPFEDYERDKDHNLLGSGTFDITRKYRFERYLDAHNIDVDASSSLIGIPATVDNNNKYKDQGDIIVSIHPTILEYEDGTSQDYGKNGHAMTVTGTSGDGRLIVSSWGRKYYVDPERVVATFQVISYP